MIPTGQVGTKVIFLAEHTQNKLRRTRMDYLASYSY